jgi:hypothetical protein
MKKIAGISLALLLLVFVAKAQETKYTSSSFARLSFTSGNTYIQRASDLGYEEGTVNSPIAEGDRLGTTDGRAEIFLGKKNYIRLDENTKIDFLNLPKKDYSLTRVRNWAGSIYLDINFLEKEKSIEVHTSDATFYILDRGLYRIDVLENKETEILVFQGVVEAAGADGSMLVKKSQRLTVSDGRFINRPASFFAGAEDTFDRWNGDRASIINRQMAKRYLTGELEDYEYELDEYGDWTNMSPYGNVWVPRGLAPDWRPYWHGRWTWLPMAGWTWIPYEPWGWSTFHYGRWHWGIGIGWYWIPMHVWGPGWVNWGWDYDYFAWAPMSYWGYPVYVVDNVFYGRGYYGDNYYNSRALTVVHKNQLQAKNVQKAALGQDVIKSLGKFELKEQSLKARPFSAPNISVEQVDGKKMIMRKGGEPVEMKPGTMPGRDIKNREASSAAKTGDRVAERSGETKGAAKTGDRVAERSGETSRGGEISKKGETPPPASQSPPNTERKIRKKKDGEAGAGSGETLFNNSTRREGFGYPSSGSITRENSSRGSGVSRSSSALDKYYRYFSSPGNSSSSRSSSFKSPASGYSAPRSVAPRSFSSPSISRGPSSGGHSSPPARSGGSVRKK